MRRLGQDEERRVAVVLCRVVRNCATAEWPLHCGWP